MLIILDNLIDDFIFSKVHVTLRISEWKYQLK